MLNSLLCDYSSRIRYWTDEQVDTEIDELSHPTTDNRITLMFMEAKLDIAKMEKENRDRLKLQNND